MQKARDAAKEALQLQPYLAEAHVAMGLVHYYLDHDYDRALAELAIARDDLPNDAVVARIIAAIQRREGRWKESTANYEKAAALDPKDPILLENMGWNFLSTEITRGQRRFSIAPWPLHRTRSPFGSCARASIFTREAILLRWVECSRRRQPNLIRTGQFY